MTEKLPHFVIGKRAKFGGAKRARRVSLQEARATLPKLVSFAQLWSAYASSRALI
jgi:hypothetical protein